MVEALARLRRGIEGGDELLAGAAAALASVPEGARHGLVRAALAEAAWLHDDRVGMREHALAGLRSAHADQFARSAGELALWASRAGAPVEPPARMHDPVRRELEDDWRGAIDAWRALDAPYEAALAALPGDERAARQAVAALQRLGAPAAARAFARDRALHGASALRGPRRSTLANAAGLARREQEVLEHVAAGATNADIARALHLSHRTVEHHLVGDPREARRHDAHGGRRRGSRGRRALARENLGGGAGQLGCSPRSRCAEPPYRRSRSSIHEPGGIDVSDGRRERRRCRASCGAREPTIGPPSTSTT